jgi:hypothetical protein
MTQAHPVPDMHARGSLAVESMTSGAIALLGACQRTNQIQLCAGIDNPSDATQNSVDFAKRSETIDINGLQAGGLRQQFFVCHENPRQWANYDHDRKMTQARLDSELQPQELLIVRSAPHTHSKFVAPARDEAAVTALPILRSVTAAVIPEAGMCGFTFDINNIPDIVRAR